MRVIDCEQNTPEWHAARCGRVTGSRVSDVVRRTKSGVSASRNTYMGELVAERLSSFQQGSTFTSAAMQWGKDNEAAAREMYQFATGASVSLVGFVVHGDFDWAGASPDALVDDVGLVSIKCPNSATHISTLLGAPIEPDYMTQMQWEMACSGRAWCDFVSFDPRLPAEMQIDIRRAPRDPARILELELAVSVFLAEIEATCAQLIAKFRQQLAAE